MPDHFFKLTLLRWLLAILPALLCTSAGAQWGDLRVNFKADGSPPKVAPVPAFGKAGCPAKILDESFVCDKAGNLKDVVVCLVPKPDSTLEVHPSYEKTAHDKVILDN